MENKRFRIYMPFIMAVLLIAGMYLGMHLQGGDANTKIDYLKNRPYDKINDILAYINEDYVDTVDLEKLKEEAVIAMLENLDPHSQYFSAEELKDINESLQGNFEGIGIEFRIIKDTIVILNVIQGGPSERSGLKAGDRIVFVDDSTFTGPDLNNSIAVKHLKGQKGSEVKIGILRPGIQDIIDFSIIRDVIPLYSIDVSYLAGNSIGYIKLSRFSATTVTEFKTAMNKLIDEGMQKLILDLRGNSGGYLQAAVRLADEFLEEDKLIVYTEGHNRPRQFAYASRRGSFENHEVVVLIDEGSASASEIVAGALQDNDRGTIIGRRSFGKGLVQEQMNLPDGSAIRLTVARYYTPTGRSIQKPYDEGLEAYHKEFFERFTNGEVQHPDSIQFPDSLKYYTPEGRVVFGGGGIMPDIYIKLRSGNEYMYYNKLINKGLIYQFSFEYADKHRNELLENYQTVDSFRSDFIISDRLFDDFLDYAEKKGVNKDDEGLKATGEKLKVLLKAFIGRDIFNDIAFYPIYNSSDETYNKAMEVLLNSQ